MIYYTSSFLLFFEFLCNKDSWLPRFTPRSQMLLDKQQGQEPANYRDVQLVRRRITVWRRAEQATK